MTWHESDIKVYRPSSDCLKASSNIQNINSLLITYALDHTIVVLPPVAPICLPDIIVRADMAGQGQANTYY